MTSKAFFEKGRLNLVSAQPVDKTLIKHLQPVDLEKKIEMRMGFWFPINPVHIFVSELFAFFESGTMTIGEPGMPGWLQQFVWKKESWFTHIFDGNVQKREFQKLA